MASAAAGSDLAARAVAVAAGLAVALAVGGCRDGQATPMPPAPALDLVPVPGTVDAGPAGEPLTAGAALDASTMEPAPRATWTLPAGPRRLATRTVAAAATAPTRDAPVPDTGPPLIDPAIVALMLQVSPAGLAENVGRLAGFGTRHALSVTGPTDRGVGAARRWVAKAFDAMNLAGAEQVQVEFEDFPLSFAGRGTTQRNVIATLPGRGRPKRFVYVVAHYDSRTQDVADGASPAPGADDDASGVAALLELARILSRRPWAAGIRLVAFAAEEQGLKGSAHHAAGARQIGLPILAVINNDIVGGSAGPDGARNTQAVRLFSAGGDGDASRRLARYVAAVADRYAGLEAVVVPRADRPGRGGDHQSFSQEGYAAVRVISATEDTDRQHSARDTVDRLDPAYHAAVVRLDLAVVANLALAPPGVAAAPVVEESADGAHVRWTAVDHPAVAGYWLATRRSGDDRYALARWVEGATEATLAMEPTPDLRVVVATADSGGHMSLFSPEGSR